METFILFGKGLFRDGKLDWVAQARCELAINLIKKNPSSRLIITGGQPLTTQSEASVMRDYIAERIPITGKIILEETGRSTVHQLIILKNNYLIPQKLFKIGLISDEMHMPRVELTARHLLGDEFQITAYKAEVRMSGKYGKLIEAFEKELFDFTAKSPVIVHCPKGDDKAWALYEKLYAEKKNKLNTIKSDLNDVNKEFLKHIKSAYR